jgi:hypothetical protein
VRVLEQEQVVCVADEEAVLQGVGVAIGHPSEPPHPQRGVVDTPRRAQSSASQSRVSRISRTRAMNAAA